MCVVTPFLAVLVAQSSQKKTSLELVICLWTLHSSRHAVVFTVSFETIEPTSLINRSDFRFFLLVISSHHSRPQGQMIHSCWTSSVSILIVIVIVMLSSGVMSSNVVCARVCGGSHRHGLVLLLPRGSSYVQLHFMMTFVQRQECDCWQGQSGG